MRTPEHVRPRQTGGCERFAFPLRERAARRMHSTPVKIVVADAQGKRNLHEHAADGQQATPCTAEGRLSRFAARARSTIALPRTAPGTPRTSRPAPEAGGRSRRADCSPIRAYRRSNPARSRGMIKKAQPASALKTSSEYSSDAPARAPPSLRACVSARTALNRSSRSACTSRNAIRHSLQTDELASEGDRPPREQGHRAIRMVRARPSVRRTGSSDLWIIEDQRSRSRRADTRLPFDN